MATTDATLFADPALGATNQNQNNKKSTAGVAAAATGAAGLGVGAAGAWAINQAGNATEDAEVEEIIIEDTEEAPVATGEGQQVSPATPATPGATTTPGAPTATPGATTTPVATPGATTDPSPTSGATTDPSATPGATTDPTATPGTTTDPTATVEPPVEVDPQIAVSNPEEIADAVIAGEEIDPNDLDGVAVMDFTDVEVVYDIEGNATTQATFIDYEGDMGVAVDVDGDGVFDVASYNDPQYGSYDINELGITVAQAEEQAEEGYLAYDENTDNIDIEIDDQDIIITDDLA